ncbi:L,D-transpeptidase [Candidatus Uhrbacteria bacterium]|nr:L,D-transpeptidase [Candidatus Uhrbacteria bacterium]
MVEGYPFVPEAASTSQRESPETKVERDFFRGLLIDTAGFERAHPFGLDVAPAAVKEKRRQQARSIFQKIRESKWGKPFMGLMGVFAGMGPLVFDRMEKHEAAPREETVEVALDDPGVQYEMKRLVIEEFMKNGEMTVEQEGRFGRQDWDQLTQLAYQGFPSLESKFAYLHKDNPDIIAAFKDPRGRLDNYRQLFEMMSLEFRHSSLPFQFSEKCIEDATNVIPSLPATESLKVYDDFSQNLYRSVGFRAVREMASKLSEKLPPGHPVMQEIQKQILLSEESAGWLKSQKANSSSFDQVTGRVRVYHHVKAQMILLDTFPANGGPANGVAWERGLPAQVAVRTPDGEFRFSRSFEKKSASWQYSWVTDTAALRWTADHKDVEYQDEDGAWRRLTGNDAEFTVLGAPEKPFKLKKKSALFNSATDRTGEEASYPMPFAPSDVLDEKGELRATWDLNDFGPRSIQMKDKTGQAMPIFFHSSPHDEQPQEFLDNSHGCIHMKPMDIDMLSGYLAKDSSIRISSGEVQKISQQENPPSSGDDGGQGSGNASARVESGPSTAG